MRPNFAFHLIHISFVFVLAFFRKLVGFLDTILQTCQSKRRQDSQNVSCYRVDWTTTSKDEPEPGLPGQALNQTNHVPILDGLHVRYAGYSPSKQNMSLA